MRQLIEVPKRLVLAVCMLLGLELLSGPAAAQSAPAGLASWPARYQARASARRALPRTLPGSRPWARLEAAALANQSQPSGGFAAAFCAGRAPSLPASVVAPVPLAAAAGELLAWLFLSGNSTYRNVQTARSLTGRDSDPAGYITGRPQ